MELDLRIEEKYGNNCNVEFFRELISGKKNFWLLIRSNCLNRLRVIGLEDEVYLVCDFF